MFDKLDDTSKSTFTFFTQTIIVIVISLPNVLIDVFFQQGRNANQDNMLIRVGIDVIQMLVSISYVYLLFIYFHGSNHFQISLPGMFFPGIFFSLQYGMIRDIHRLTTAFLGLPATVYTDQTNLILFS